MRPGVLWHNAITGEIKERLFAWRDRGWVVDDDGAGEITPGEFYDDECWTPPLEMALELVPDLFEAAGRACTQGKVLKVTVALEDPS